MIRVFLYFNLVLSIADASCWIKSGASAVSARIQAVSRAPLLRQQFWNHSVTAQATFLRSFSNNVKENPEVILSGVKYIQHVIHRLQDKDSDILQRPHTIQHYLEAGLKEIERDVQAQVKAAYYKGRKYTKKEKQPLAAIILAIPKVVDVNQSKYDKKVAKEVLTAGEDQLSDIDASFLDSEESIARRLFERSCSFEYVKAVCAHTEEEELIRIQDEVVNKRLILAAEINSAVSLFEDNCALEEVKQMCKSVDEATLERIQKGVINRRLREIESLDC